MSPLMVVLLVVAIVAVAVAAALAVSLQRQRAVIGSARDAGQTVRVSTPPTPASPPAQIPRMELVSRSAAPGVTEMRPTPAPPITPLAARVSRGRYEVLLTRVGDWLDRRTASEIVVGEVEGGYLLLYFTGDGPAVTTLTLAEIGALPLASASTPGSLGARLGAVGHFLDDHFIISPLLEEQEKGFYVEYTASPMGAFGTERRVRTSSFFAHDTLTQGELRDEQRVSDWRGSAALAHQEDPLA